MFGFSPSELLVYALMLGVPVVGTGYLVWRFIRAYERRGVARAELDVVKEQLARLEESVNAAGAHLESLSEGQRFTTQVLTERASRKVERDTE